jgi:uncharacterized membrane protein
MVVGLMVSLVFTTVVYEPENRLGVQYADLENDEFLEFDPDDEQSSDNEADNSAQEIDEEVASLAEQTSGTRGGELEWKYKAVKGGEISTPALVDLDSDGFLEVVFVTTGDEIVALNHDGSERWINSNYVIEHASHFSSELSLDFWPADLFSSITPANIDRDVRPEIILGAYNGLVFLNHDGEPKFSQAHTGRFYFSTPVVLDLEGDYSNIDMDGNRQSHYKDLEILTGSDDTNRNAYLEAWHSTGGDIFDYTVAQSGESAFVLGIATGDLDGSMEDEVYHDGEEAWMEIVFATHDRGMRIFEYKGASGGDPTYDEANIGQISGHLSYATAAVGNFSKVVNSQYPPMLEIIVGKGGWHGPYPGTPISTGAGLFCYDEQGNEKWSSLDQIIVISSPAVGDVQTQDRDEATKHLAEYEIFACNSYEGEIYSVDADDGSVIWQWQIDGAKSESNRVLSSPALCNINSDDELEVVVGSDNGKVYCFDGDPSDGNNDGDEFTYSGEGSTFDLLWEFDSHQNEGTGKIGVSSPVVADIDKDGQLEVIIGDTEGTLWCISAGGTASRGQRDWTMFHYDLNNSGFYDPRVTYAVDIKPARDPTSQVVDSREKFVEPGEMVTFNLSVINDGRGLSQEDFDNIYIETYITSNLTNTGWKYTLKGDAISEHDGLKFVKLPMQEATTIQLNVTAPWAGDMGDFISIVVKVNSSMDDNSFSSITTITHLQIKIDFNLEFSWLPESDPQSPYFNKKIDEIMPGEERTYTINVQNIGNINDTYRISLSDYERGWDIRFLNSVDPLNFTVQLDSGIFEDAENATQIQLSVRVPIDELGDEITFISIEGLSLLSEKEQEKEHPLIGRIIRRDTMLIKIGNVPRLQLLTDEGEKYIMPGETAKYKVYVKNNGNVDYLVALSTSEPTTGWTVIMTNSIEVRSQEQKLVEVFLTAPEEQYQVKAETREMISIEGLVDTAKGILSSSVGIVGVMDHVYHLNVSVSPSINTTSPGGEVSYHVTIENLGNGDDTIKLSPLSLELGWNMTFSKGDKFSLEWKETLTIEFEMRVPMDALAGKYTSILNVSDSNPYEKNFVTVQTIVLQSYDVSIGAYNEDHDLYMSDTTQYVTPGSTTMYDVRVTNEGNGEDIASLWLYLYKYKQPAAGGSLSEVTKTKEESDLMMQDAVTGGGIRWYIKSVQSSPGAFTAEPVYQDFAEVIDVDRVAEKRYQPKEETDFATKASLLLYPGQSAWVQVEIDYPADEFLDPMFFAIDAVSAGEDIRPANNVANLNLSIKFSDLTFDTSLNGKGMEVIGAKRDDNPQLNVRARIRNIGEIDARDIEIALYVDDQFLDSRTVMRLVNSSVETGEYKDILISFAWKPVAGKHKIEVRIDPDNSIVEANEQNNIAGETVNIESQNLVSSFLGQKGTCPIIFVILAAVVVGMATYYVLKKRKKQNET